LHGVAEEWESPCVGICLPDVDEAACIGCDILIPAGIEEHTETNGPCCLRPPPSVRRASS